MKSISLLSLFVLVAPLAAQEKAPPGESKIPVVQQDLMQSQRAFLNLPEEIRKDFFKHQNEANRLYDEKRIFESLEEVYKASKIFPDSPELFNIRGRCFIEMRAFDKALVQFENALVYLKDNPNVEFNLAVVYFCTKKWQQALNLFEKILKEIPPQNIAFGRLVEFNILLCKKKLGQNDEVTILAEKYDYLDDSPFYYYARAALAFEDKNTVKAQEWLAIAGRIFQDPEILAPWEDTLVEYGLIKSFYGAEVLPKE